MTAQQVAAAFNISEELAQRLINLGIRQEILLGGKLQELLEVLTSLAEHSTSALEIKAQLPQS